MIKQGKRFLFIFDFDHTIVNLNTDTYIQRVLPNQKLPQNVIDMANQSWTKFVQASLSHISDQNISVQQLKECLQTMQLTKGFEKVLEFMQQNQESIDGVIVSDSNTFFIESVLEKYGKRELFKNIITNPATVDYQNQKVSMVPYHSHNCPKQSCPKNLCKHIALKEGLSWDINVRSYERVYYFGDGGNDYCPLQLLQKQDVVFARKDFKLHELLESNHVECQKFIWENGEQIVDSNHFSEIKVIV